MQVQARTVVVTGAASGIGFETVRRFAALGDRVFAVDRDPPPAAAGADVPPVSWLTGDVSRPDDVQRVIAAAAATGRIDVVCNNAGIGSTADAVSCTPEEWDEVFAVNAKGVFLGTKFALPLMLDQGGGVIVNTASVAGLVGLPDRAAYCASKGAVVAFTRQVAVQYASRGIRCTCVCPGTVDSPWVGRLLAGASDPAAAREALVARQPLGRLATSEEIADAIIYLASPAASFITGTPLVIDGGIMAG